MFDKGQAMLLWALECEPEMSPEWNEWYNMEHFALLLQVPGFLSGNRYVKKETLPLPGMEQQRQVPEYLTYYELYDEHVLASEAYLTNRTSSGPGMRPEWTKRMLTYLTQIFGGTYRPLSDTWLRSADRSCDLLLALYIDPIEGREEAVDKWYAGWLLPFLQQAGNVKAARLLGNLAVAPNVKGGVQQASGPSRVILCTVEDSFLTNPLTSGSIVWEKGSSCISHAATAVYDRMRL